jgi:hypothetical protein
MNIEQEIINIKQRLDIIEKVKPAKDPTMIQKVVEVYKKIKEYDKEPGWDKIHFARASKSAKILISELVTIEKIKDCITWTSSQGYPEWTIETCVKKMFDYKKTERKHEETRKSSFV